MKLFWMTCFWILLTNFSVAANDLFDEVKAQLGDAETVWFEFISILESDIFETVDSSWGEARFAADGRFDISIGLDRFSFDGRYTYDFSYENQQVVRREAQSAGGYGELSFIVRLDSFYVSQSIIDDREYRLKRRDTFTNSDIPDILTVLLDTTEKRIHALEFHDINDELNRIVILSRKLLPHMPDSIFTPDFPDSVEVMKL